MEIRIIRNTTNPLYTEGQIMVNDKQNACTVEHTPTMLPAGYYRVCLRKHKSKKRIIRIAKTDWSIGTGLSWIASRKNRVIAIGQPLIPGSVYKATDIYKRLFERIEKCLKRKETVSLVVDETQCVSNKPIRHWKA